MSIIWNNNIYIFIQYNIYTINKIINEQNQLHYWYVVVLSLESVGQHSIATIHSSFRADHNARDPLQSISFKLAA